MLLELRALEVTLGISFSLSPEKLSELGATKTIQNVREQVGLRRFLQG